MVLPMSNHISVDVDYQNSFVYGASIGTEIFGLRVGSARRVGIAFIAGGGAAIFYTMRNSVFGEKGA